MSEITQEKIPDFRDELAMLLNKHSKENYSNTPDFILANYLNDCLYAYDRACNDRTKWYGIPPPKEDSWALPEPNNK